ncbi:hypothetical protein K431DRAFT_286401 [Polychaeton citri CBS 116435]|uniref:Transglutaminase-like domain-containing protein n=1 Tax=Polychaeton citri CBS 116435 TaxID=1314669 RepID=A0A9P4Q7B3_9PEZI|nr:hypothetical protein K431DRAFT_286401 [Polychaeton citri CBS 116435]
MPSIQERIAALQLQEVGRVPGQPPPSYDQATANSPANTVNSTGRAKPPPPPRPSAPPRPQDHVRRQSAQIPVNGATGEDGIANQPDQSLPSPPTRPAVPPRTSTQKSNGPSLPPRKPSQSPALPPRRPSEAPSISSRRPSEMGLSRRGSQESVSSIATTRSSVSGISNGTSVTSQSDRYTIRAPSFDPASLPPLPPKRTQEEKEAADRQLDRPSLPQRKRESSSLLGKLTQPALPSRFSRSSQTQTQTQTQPRPQAQAQPQVQSQTQLQTQPQPREPAPAPAGRVLLPPPSNRPRKSALDFGFDNKAQPPTANINPGRPESTPATNGVPPPIPTGSRPDLASLQACKPKLNGAPNTPAPTAGVSCLHCRDFSGPDNHAARFPRESIPNGDTGILAHQLCDPFPSHTDKARAIFTWCHHNIAYDVYSFMNNCIKPSTPQGTIQSGLAVCEGYAGLYAALAMKAGLECVVLSGASKGFGHAQWKPGMPLPEYDCSHAWNVVRIDNGEWKLIDACWGAGSISCDAKSYKKGFHPERFTQSNNDFGRDHFPGDDNKQYRTDGRVQSWEEFVTGSKHGTAAQMFNGFVEEEGLMRGSFKPAANPISLSQQGPAVRFSFQKICPHWDPYKQGKGGWLIYAMYLDGLEGDRKNLIPFNFKDGVWWCDVPTQDLGRPGMKAKIYAIKTMGDDHNPRGWTKEQFLAKKGRVGWSSGGVAYWDIVP